MPDNRTKEQRSYNMSRIRSENTKPEIVVRRFLYAHGIRFRIHVKAIPGKPDIVIRKFRSLIFVNGCFWHGHESCKFAKMPASNSFFWLTKLSSNKRRDFQNISFLKREGWNVFVVWECELNSDRMEEVLMNLLAELVSQK